jgi:hypothetical protein
MKKPNAIQNEYLEYLFELEPQFRWEMPPCKVQIFRPFRMHKKISLTQK